MREQIYMIEPNMDQSQQSKSVLSNIFSSNSPLKNMNQFVEATDSGLEIVKHSRLQLVTENIQMQKKIADLGDEDNRFQKQITELQGKMDNARLQSASKELCHLAIVDSLESLAAEDQLNHALQVLQLHEKYNSMDQECDKFQRYISILTNELDELMSDYEYLEANSAITKQSLFDLKREHSFAKEQMTETVSGLQLEQSAAARNKLKMEAECTFLKDEVSGLKIECSELAKDLIVEKRTRVQEAITRQDLVDKIQELEEVVQNMIQRNMETEAAKEKVVDECKEQKKVIEDKECHLIIQHEEIKQMEIYQESQQEIINKFVEKKNRRKGWKKLTCS